MSILAERVGMCAFVVNWSPSQAFYPRWRSLPLPEHLSAVFGPRPFAGLWLLVDQTTSDPALLCSAARHLQVPCRTSRVASCPVAKARLCMFGVVLICEADNASESFVSHSRCYKKNKSNKSTVVPIFPISGQLLFDCFQGRAGSCHHNDLVASRTVVYGGSQRWEGSRRVQPVPCNSPLFSWLGTMCVRLPV